MTAISALKWDPLKRLANEIDFWEGRNRAKLELRRSFVGMLFGLFLQLLMNLSLRDWHWESTWLFMNDEWWQFCTPPNPKSNGPIFVIFDNPQGQTCTPLERAGIAHPFCPLFLLNFKSRTASLDQPTNITITLFSFLFSPRLYLSPVFLFFYLSLSLFFSPSKPFVLWV